MISSSTNKPKTSWWIIQDEMGKSERKTNSQFVKYDDLTINPIQIANAFNGYFIDVVDSLQTEHVHIHHALKLLQSSFPHSST